MAGQGPLTETLGRAELEGGPGAGREGRRGGYTRLPPPPPPRGRICPSTRPPSYLSVSPSTCPFTHPSIYPPTQVCIIHPPTHSSVHLSCCLPVHLSAHSSLKPSRSTPRSRIVPDIHGLAQLCGVGGSHPWEPRPALRQDGSHPAGLWEGRLQGAAESRVLAASGAQMLQGFTALDDRPLWEPWAAVRGSMGAAIQGPQEGARARTDTQLPRPHGQGSLLHLKPLSRGWSPPPPAGGLSPGGPAAHVAGSRRASCFVKVQAVGLS